jgi:hypothetical protein
MAAGRSTLRQNLILILPLVLMKKPFMSAEIKGFKIYSGEYV